MKELLTKYKKWLILLAGLLIITLIITAMTSAITPQPRLKAPPPVEDEVTFDMEVNQAYSAEDGIIVIPTGVIPAASSSNQTLAAIEALAAVISDSPDTVWIEGELPQSRNYTLPEDAQMADGSIGLLSIPKIGLAVNVYETDDEMEAMTKGLAHFKTTSAWSGNIGLCGHNVNFDLTDGYLKNLHTLKSGDIISYKTALGSRAYTVETVAEIDETDWSYLGRTEDDRITLITCISGKPRSRLVVQATIK